MAKLTTKGRKRINSSNFAIPSKKKYPIHDISHARSALARVAQHGTPAEKRQVRAAVCKKYPSLKSCTTGNKTKKNTTRRKK